ncbi:MAG: Putative cytokinin riboside 5'-monophosphate phosphoribohydrolase [Peptostreptococcus russellii]|uniref:Cytokinin riboside 5'-monophosphate phosphoribohydrolase n=1 Tax=Peptostreptococcus russellii TaxID=215200 RepID=A0A2P7PZP7_9FIRM|nr:TIGR00730 family Rossman fold protein [Peptostreptococcus russellii]PSJ31209.1 hypothetical protein UF10_06090 [Peptostreptococcus russellii]
MNITVYCGSNMGSNKKYRSSAIELAKWICKNDHSLLYGGGASGLMGVIADTVLENGGKVLGVRPEFLSDIEAAHSGVTQLIKVENMSERKKIMIENGDLYIALPGGLGTLEEVSEVLSWSMIGRISNPCIILNIDGFYEDLKSQFIKMADEGFLSEENNKKLVFIDSIEEMEEYLSGLYKSLSSKIV